MKLTAEFVKLIVERLIETAPAAREWFETKLTDEFAKPIFAISLQIAPPPLFAVLLMKLTEEFMKLISTLFLP
jgi:hypothetical protein